MHLCTKDQHAINQKKNTNESHQLGVIKKRTLCKFIQICKRKFVSVGWFLSAFSLPKNYYRLTAKNTNPDAIKLQSIQGIRLYTMFCVVMTHTIMYHLRGPVMNPKYTENVIHKMNELFLLYKHFRCTYR